MKKGMRALLLLTLCHPHDRRQSLHVRRLRALGGLTNGTGPWYCDTIKRKDAGRANEKRVI